MKSIVNTQFYIVLTAIEKHLKLGIENKNNTKLENGQILHVWFAPKTWNELSGMINNIKVELAL